jgi:hypothetical protein
MNSLLSFFHLQSPTTLALAIHIRRLTITFTVSVCLKTLA